jgi:hypothetical protein
MCIMSRFIQYQPLFNFSSMNILYALTVNRNFIYSFSESETVFGPMLHLISAPSFRILKIFIENKSLKKKSAHVFLPLYQ